MSQEVEKEMQTIRENALSAILELANLLTTDREIGIGEIREMGWMAESAINHCCDIVWASIRIRKITEGERYHDIGSRHIDLLLRIAELEKEIQCVIDIEGA